MATEAGEVRSGQYQPQSIIWKHAEPSFPAIDHVALKQTLGMMMPKSFCAHFSQASKIACMQDK
jgi:hypothetical protein